MPFCNETIKFYTVMSISCISSIFKGIDELLKEATNEDVVKFLGESFISLKNDFAVKSVS